MLQEAMSMQSGNSQIQEEMREVEEELEEDSSRHDSQNPRGSSVPLEAAEEGKAGGLGANPSSPSTRHFSSSARNSRSQSPKSFRRPSIAFPLSGGAGPMGRKNNKHWLARLRDRIRNGLQVMTNPVFAQAFLLTFLGEWGDRSQITTIAMGGAHVGYVSASEGGY